MLTTLSANISSVFDRIVKSEKKVNKMREAQIRELLFNIEDSKSEIKLAMDNFNNVTEPKLIDYYIYKIQSEQTRFEQLVAEYKTLYQCIIAESEK